MEIDLGVVYQESRLRVSEMVISCDDTIAVPATPGWDVHAVVAHLAGAAEDARTGNLDGVTTDPWTAAQVVRGKDKSVSELCAQWAQDSIPLESFLSTPEGKPFSNAVFDVCSHEADLLSAMGQPVDLPEDFLAFARRAMTKSFYAQVASAGLDPIEVSALPLEIFRSRLGRRTEAEVMAYDWSALATDYLDLWFIFGRCEKSLGEFSSS